MAVSPNPPPVGGCMHTIQSDDMDMRHFIVILLLLLILLYIFIIIVVIIIIIIIIQGYRRATCTLLNKTQSICYARYHRSVVFLEDIVVDDRFPFKWGQCSFAKSGKKKECWVQVIETLGTKCILRCGVRSNISGIFSAVFLLFWSSLVGNCIHVVIIPVETVYRWNDINMSCLDFDSFFHAFSCFVWA